MSRSAAALMVGAAAVLAAGALVWWLAAGRARPQHVAEDGPTAVDGGFETISAELYFPNAAGWLGVERRELPAAGSAAERARQIATALLEGPVEPGHLAPLAGVEVAGVHVSAERVVYLDLAAAELAAPPVSGSRGELLAVYSFVNSILANVPEARGVALLWNGNQRPTFAGHVDTTRPLLAEQKWRAH